MTISEFAGGLIDFGIEVAGSVVEAAGSIARQAGDFVNTAGLKAQLLDKEREYDKLMKELGCALYDTVKDDPAFVEADPGLFAQIAGVVAARQDLVDKIAEEQAAADARRPIDVEPVDVDIAEPEPVASAPAGYRSATIGGTGEGA